MSLLSRCTKCLVLHSLTTAKSCCVIFFCLGIACGDPHDLDGVADHVCGPLLALRTSGTFDTIVPFGLIWASGSIRANAQQ